MNDEKMPKKHLPDEAFIEAAKACHGICGDIAKLLGVHPDTVTNRRKKSPAIDQAIRRARDPITDRAENNIISAIKNGSITASKYWLSTIGKDRGYSTRVEVEGDTQRTSQVVIVRGEEKPSIPADGAVRVILPENGRESPDIPVVDEDFFDQDDPDDPPPDPN